MKKLLTSDRIIIILLIILIGFGVNYHFNKTNDLNKKHERQLKLSEALNDSVRYYSTENGEFVAEKRTLQGDIKDLKLKNDVLNASQRQLLNTVDRLNSERKKDKKIFAAAQIKYEKFIDSLNVVIASASKIDTLNNVISFVQNDTSANFIYDLDILGVRPFPDNALPSVKFNQIDFPNTQVVTFNFDKNKRNDYPISFSVVNTNPYYKAYDIESYAIEGLEKEKIDPTKWQKVWKWVKINGKYILVGAAGFVIGTSVSGN